MGEINDPRGSGLPESETCLSDCAEFAVLGDRSVILARDEDGIPFVAVSLDRNGSWGPAIPGDDFMILDAWFMDRVEGDYGAVAIGVTYEQLNMEITCGSCPCGCY